MSWNLTQPNAIYDIYGRSLDASLVTTEILISDDIHTDSIEVNGESVPTIATTAEVNAGTSTTKAIAPESAASLGFQSYNKIHGVFYGFSGSYNNASTDLNITNGAQWYTSGISIISPAIIRISSLNKKTTLSIIASIQSTLTTAGQVFNLDIQNNNTDPSDPIVRCGTYLITSSSSQTSFTSSLFGLVDIDNNIVDLVIKITSINLNGGSSIAVSNTNLLITEL